MFWDLVAEYFGSFILLIAFVFTSIFGKPKTSEQVKKTLLKREEKLQTKVEKLLGKLVDLSEQISKIDSNNKKGG